MVTAVRRCFLTVFFLRAATSAPERMLQMQPTTENGSGCDIPVEWRGEWFHNEATVPLRIGPTSMSSNGECVGRRGDRFLFRQQTKTEECWKCVVFYSVHANVLQYKETPRCSRDSLEKVCERFSGDTPLKILFRGGATAERCPIDTPANFTYKDIRGDCVSRVSTVDSCAATTQIVFRFQACPDVDKSQAKEDRYTCIGQWRWNGKNYFAAKLATDYRSRDDDSLYRCFIYELDGQKGTIGVSADASCRIWSPTDESTPMRISFVSDYYPMASCSFAHWLRRSRRNSNIRKEWEALDGKRVHRFDKHEWTTADAATGANVSTAICVSAEDYGKHARFVVQKLDGCARRYYQCVDAYRRDGQVMELAEGAQSATAQDACSSRERLPAGPRFQTLLLRDSAEKPCPNSGHRYSIHGCDEARSTLSFGCTFDHQLVVSRSCRHNQTETYNCHGGWAEGDHEYLVVRQKHTGKRSCIVYSRNGRSLSMTLSHRQSCERQVVTESSQWHAFLNASGLESCDGDVAALSGVAPLTLSSAALTALLILARALC